MKPDDGKRIIIDLRKQVEEVKELTMQLRREKPVRKDELTYWKGALFGLRRFLKDMEGKHNI